MPHNESLWAKIEPRDVIHVSIDLRDKPTNKIPAQMYVDMTRIGTSNRDQNLSAASEKGKRTDEGNGQCCWVHALPWGHMSDTYQRGRRNLKSVGILVEEYAEMPRAACECSVVGCEEARGK